MFIREIQAKFTSEFQKSELGKFIPNFPLKHVITSTNDTEVQYLIEFLYLAKCY